MIPFIRVVGTDVQVENERVIKGLVRNAMDAQAINTTSGRRATPSMWRFPRRRHSSGRRAFAEGSEDVWQTANDTPHA